MIQVALARYEACQVWQCASIHGAAFCEHAGGVNKEGMQFFKMCQDAADNKLNARASDLSSWSSKRLSHFYSAVDVIS